MLKFPYSEVKVTQSCPTLCNPMDYTVHGILQARILERSSLSLLQGIFPTQVSNPRLPCCRWILYQLSHNNESRPLMGRNGKIKGLIHVLAQSCLTLGVTPWTVACQTPLSIGFSRQVYWSELPCSPPGESSWPRDWTWGSCIADRFFTVQARLIQMGFRMDFLVIMYWYGLPRWH